jgi:hypothetical protein
MGRPMGTVTGTVKTLAGEVRNLQAVNGMARSILQPRQDPKPPERADALADITLRDHEGQKVRLGAHWSGGMAALVFLRHWG